jgi:transmembrane sensor
VSAREILRWDDQDRIDHDAADWLARRSESLTPEEAAEYEAWRASDPRHARIYDAMAKTWHDTASLKQLAGLAPLDSGPSRPARAPTRFRPWHGAAAFATAAALVTVALLPTAPVDSATHQTRVAEVRQLTLPDGTLVTLGARSRILVDFSSRQRRVELTEGQAFFDVAQEAARPFLVVAGQASIRDIGTKFDVTRTAGSLRVSVLEGSVEVRDAGGEHASVLHAGQRFESIRRVTTARTAAPNVQPVKDAAPGGWREGRLAYEDGRLADVVEDLNRYYAAGVRIVDDAGEVRVTASFRTDEIPSFLQTLESALPVTVAQDGTGAFTLRTR